MIKSRTDLKLNITRRSKQGRQRHQPRQPRPTPRRSTTNPENPRKNMLSAGNRKNLAKIPEFGHLNGIFARKFAVDLNFGDLFFLGHQPREFKNREISDGPGCDRVKTMEFTNKSASVVL